MSNLPPIPDVPADASPELQNFLLALKEVVETREGTRGESGDRFVTYDNLEAASAYTSLGLTKDQDDTLIADSSPINSPTNLSITKGVWKNHLSWTNPTDVHFSHIEVWVNTTDSVTSATRVAIVTGPANTYEHSFGDYTNDHYYWIRAIAYSGVYSPWTPRPSQGGYVIPGDESIGETIDGVVDILKGTDPSEYNSGNEYSVSDLVKVTTGTSVRRYRCIQANGSADPKLPGTDTAYWERAGILMTGDVDGTPTVAIDGNLIVDDTILARHVKAGTFTGDEFNASAEINLSEGGKATFGDSNVIIETSDNGDTEGRIIVAPNGGISGQNYVLIDEGQISQKYYDTTTGLHATQGMVTGIEYGEADNGDTVQPDTLFIEQPKIMLMPKIVPVYDQTYSGYDQTFNLQPMNVQRQSGYSAGSPAKWEFDVVATLELGSTVYPNSADTDRFVEGSSAQSGTYYGPSSSGAAADDPVHISDVRRFYGTNLVFMVYGRYEAPDGSHPTWLYYRTRNCTYSAYVQYSLNNGSSWTTCGSGTNTGTNGPGVFGPDQLLVSFDTGTQASAITHMRVYITISSWCSTWSNGTTTSFLSPPASPTYYYRVILPSVSGTVVLGTSPSLSTDGQVAWIIMGK